MNNLWVGLRLAAWVWSILTVWTYSRL